MERETIHELSKPTPLSRKLPDVPIAEGVDLAALTPADGKPAFVTLEIAQVGRVSKNGIVYDEYLVDTIVEQINQKRVGGNFGHIPKDQRDSAFPLPDGLWVGAMRVGDKAYGKAYLRNPEAAQYVADLRAVGGKLGTSIYGEGWSVSDGQNRRRLKEFELEKIDFAPPERASLRLSGDFEVTAEMHNEDKGKTMDEVKTAVQQMSDDDLMTCVGDERFGKLAEMWMKKNKKKMVAAEFVSEISDADRTQIAELNAQNAAQARELTTLRQRVAEFEKAEFEEGLTALVESAIDWKTNDEKQARRVNSLRRQLRNVVVTELDGRQDLSYAKAKIAEVMQSEDFLAVAEAVRDSLAGGTAIVGGAGKSEKERLVEAGRETLSKMGIRSKGGA